MSSICLSNNNLHASLTEGFLRLIFEFPWAFEEGWRGESPPMERGLGLSHGEGAQT